MAEKNYLQSKKYVRSIALVEQLYPNTERAVKLQLSTYGVENTFVSMKKH
nr:hypothetical protein [Dysgonomonas sp. Marseille-P4361]